MNLFVFGHKGQLGTDCLEVFAGHDVHGADLPETDASDRAACRAVLDRFQPEAVINCAAFTAVDACETEKEKAWKANADAPRWMAEWCRDRGARLIHISTDYVFSGDRPADQAWIETDPPAPVSEYGRSKLAGEQAVAEICADHAILRTAWLYGRHGKNFLKTMLNLSLQGKPLRVVNDQTGCPTWSFTLARQIQRLLATDANGIFHAVSSGRCTWYQFALTFLDLMRVPHDLSPCTTADYPTPARRPANSVLENRRLNQLGINLFGDWQTELEQFVCRHRDTLLKQTAPSETSPYLL